jgi:formamidopyrimidine-DNA glycosylase
MPELPEVETVRSQLQPQLAGQRIVQSWARLPRITQPSIETFVSATQGQTILEARRRAKQLYFPLESGANLLIHLGMTGRLHVEAAPESFNSEALHKHIHAVLRLDNGQQLVFTDPRTFGALAIAENLDFLNGYGPEPLDEDFDEAAIVQALARRSIKIKAALLDQKIVAGLGNIYADEVCFLAGVHPATPANAVSPEKLRIIVSHMRPVLELAIQARGATLKDGGYQDTFGAFGEFIPDVYGRTGQECKTCQTPIERGTLGKGKSARSYHFCPRCQKI